MPLGLTDLLLPGAVLTVLSPAAVALLLQVWMCPSAPLLSGKGKTTFRAHPPNRVSTGGGQAETPNTAPQPQKRQQRIQDIVMSPPGSTQGDGSFHSTYGCLYWACDWDTLYSMAPIANTSPASHWPQPAMSIPGKAVGSGCSLAI